MLRIRDWSHERFFYVSWAFWIAVALIVGWAVFYV